MKAHSFLALKILESSKKMYCSLQAAKKNVLWFAGNERYLRWFDLWLRRRIIDDY